MFSLFSQPACRSVKWFDGLMVGWMLRWSISTTLTVGQKAEKKRKRKRNNNKTAHAVNVDTPCCTQSRIALQLLLCSCCCWRACCTCNCSCCCGLICGKKEFAVARWKMIFISFIQVEKETQMGNHTSSIFGIQD